MNNKLKTFAFFALALASTIASANSITTATQSITIPTTINNWTNNFIINQFNPALGILQSVSYNLSVTTSGNGLVTNNSATTPVTNFQLFLTSTVTTTAPNNSIIQATSSNSTVQTIAPSATVTVNVTPNTGSTNVVETSPAQNLAPYIGTGTITLPVSAVGSFLSGGSGGIPSVTTSTYSSATLSYSYAYSNIPEPATLLLMGIGVLGMGLAASRRKS